MEDRVGQLWHRLIAVAAADGYPLVAVELQPLNRRLSMLFRALGGDLGLRLDNATALCHDACRGWLQRIAGIGGTAELA